MRFTFCGMLVLALLATQASAATQKDIDDCKNDSGQTAIAACTRVIGDSKQPPGTRAAALYFRAVEFFDADNYDRAIADLTEAIKIEPKVARFYFKRADAWVEKEN